MHTIHYIDAKTGQRWEYPWPCSGDKQRLLRNLFEGNWACDCNRYLDILRAQDAPDIMEIDPPCDVPNRYVIERVVSTDGKDLRLPKSPLDQCKPELKASLQGYLA